MCCLQPRNVFTPCALIANSPQRCTRGQMRGSATRMVCCLRYLFAQWFWQTSMNFMQPFQWYSQLYNYTMTIVNASNPACRRVTSTVVQNSSYPDKARLFSGLIRVVKRKMTFNEASASHKISLNVIKVCLTFHSLFNCVCISIKNVKCMWHMFHAMSKFWFNFEFTVSAGWTGKNLFSHYFTWIRISVEIQ